jgi:hypothetical protein
MSLQSPPSAISPPSLPLPSLADRASYGPRRREWLRWEDEDLAPGIKSFVDNVFSNAEFASQMAAQAASVAGFRGAWSAQTGAAAMPYSVVHNDMLWVLLQDVATVQSHEPGVSSVWLSFQTGGSADETAFDDSVASLGATDVQLAIEKLVLLLGGKVARTSATGSIALTVGTTAQRDSPASTGMTRWNTDLSGSRGALDIYNGSEWETSGWVIGSSVTLTGATVEFNSVPAWVNEIKIRLRGASTNGSSNILFQLGTTLAFETTGYDSTGDGASSTAGFVVLNSSAGNSITGEAVFQRGPGLTWDYSFVGTSVSTNRTATGVKTMAGQVTRLRISAGGATNFDAGTAHVMWRK